MNNLNELKPQELYQPNLNSQPYTASQQPVVLHNNNGDENIQHHEEVEESLSIMDKEKELII